MYKVLAIIGKAGSGKDTLLNACLDRYKDKLHGIVSYTTRPPREGEVDSVNYFFVSEEEFTEMTLDLQMLETSCFNNWMYGTAERSLVEDKINIGVFNPEGIRSMQEFSDIIDLKVVYVWASDKERLLRQLNREAYPDVDEIVRRYGTDKADFKDIRDLKNVYEVVNDVMTDVDTVVDGVSIILDEFV